LNASPKKQLSKNRNLRPVIKGIAEQAWLIIQIACFSGSVRRYSEADPSLNPPNSKRRDSNCPEKKDLASHCKL
jgi:hypothetical protein